MSKSGIPKGAHQKDRDNRQHMNYYNWNSEKAGKCILVTPMVSYANKFFLGGILMYKRPQLYEKAP